MTAPAPLAPTLAALTPAQVRAVKLLGYPSWTAKDLLTGVSYSTLVVLERLRLAVHGWHRCPRCDFGHLPMFRLTQRGLRVKRGLARPKKG